MPAKVEISVQSSEVTYELHTLGWNPHFDTLSSSPRVFQEELAGSPATKQAIERGFNRIRETVQELEAEHASPDEDCEGYGGAGRLSEPSDDRSIFDDVDE